MALLSQETNVRRLYFAEGILISVSLTRTDVPPKNAIQSHGIHEVVPTSNHEL